MLRWPLQLHIKKRAARRGANSDPQFSIPKVPTGIMGAALIAALAMVNDIFIGSFCLMVGGTALDPLFSPWSLPGSLWVPSSGQFLMLSHTGQGGGTSP